MTVEDILDQLDEMVEKSFRVGNALWIRAKSKSSSTTSV